MRLTPGLDHSALIYVSRDWRLTSWPGNTFRIAGLCEGNHRSSMDSPTKASYILGFDVFFIATLNKVLDKQSSCWWLDTLWYLCEVTVLCLLILNNLSMQWNTNINVLNDTISKLFVFCVPWKALIKALIYFPVSRNWEVAYVWYKTPSRPNSGHNSGNCLQTTT